MKKVLFFAILALFFVSCGSKKANDSSENFVVLTDVVPDVILEMRYYSTYNIVGKRIDGYEQPIALMTRQAADSLKMVSDDLRKHGYRIKIWDAYRPKRAVNHLIRWDKDLDNEVNYSHSRGSSVDLTLVDEQTGLELDMGSPLDVNLTPTQLANRLVLRHAMLSHGFVGLDNVWWHFTLADEPFPDTYFDFPVRDLK